MLREALSTAPHRFHQQSGSTPHDAGTIDPPPHRPPPFWLALARQRSRLHRRATPARSPTPNPLAQRTGRAFKVDSAIFRPKAIIRTAAIKSHWHPRPAQIPIALAAPAGCPTHRDFVPWRFSDAGRMSAWRARLAGVRKPAQYLHSCGHRAPPSARMCKRCSLLTELPRDHAEVSLFQWRKRRHIYRVGAAYTVAAWVMLRLVKAELLEESHA